VLIYQSDGRTDGYKERDKTTSVRSGRHYDDNGWHKDNVKDKLFGITAAVSWTQEQVNDAAV